MNQPASNTTTVNTFIVRIWREHAGVQSRWRGRIEHVQSGTWVAFTDARQIASFMGRFVELAQDREMGEWER